MTCGIFFSSVEKNASHFFSLLSRLFFSRECAAKNIIMFSLVTQHIKSVSIHFRRKQPRQRARTQFPFDVARKKFGNMYIKKSWRGELRGTAATKKHSAGERERELRSSSAHANFCVTHYTWATENVYNRNPETRLEQICSFVRSTCKTLQRKDWTSQQEIPPLPLMMAREVGKIVVQSVSARPPKNDVKSSSKSWYIKNVFLYIPKKYTKTLPSF